MSARRAALLTLVAWQFSVVAPLLEIRPFSVDPDAISNIELLVPLRIDEQSVSARNPRVEFDKLYAFTLDNTLASVRESGGGGASASHGREEDASEQLAQACERLAGHGGGVGGGAAALVLRACGVLLGGRGGAPRCAGEPSANGRRDLMPMGNNAYLVKHHLNIVRKQRDQLHNESIIRAATAIYMNNVVVSPAQAHPTYTAATRSRFSAMRSGALFALVAWQFLLVEPLHEVQPYDVDADALEMLIPLLMSEQNDRSDRTQDSDEAFSSIPAYAFTLDETLPPVPFASPAQSVPLVSPTQSASRGSRKRDLSRDQEVNRVARPRALLLGDNNSDDDDEGQELWRACERLASSRAGGALEVLMYLCAELLDAAGPRGLSPCPCCGASNGPRVSYVTLKDSNPLHISSVVGRREHRPLGDNEDVVQRYAQVLRKKRMRLGR